MYYYEEKKEKYRRIIISCNENGCTGVFIHESWLGDHSPRVEEKCSKCERFISVKLSSIDERRIISQEIIEE